MHHEKMHALTFPRVAMTSAGKLEEGLDEEE
jgi:hypothetical protein